jgi:competence protein ComEC
MHGIRKVLVADRVVLTGRRRRGISGAVDRVRDRAEASLSRGMRERESALAGGMVLGQDDRIDPETILEFKRSGLAHLLAVSGQNVILLVLLATPLLAAAGLALRGRLVCVLALIALYVAVTGAGPSIQRAGMMGAAGIVAALAGRPRSRIYVLLLAACVTLAVNPRAGADVGWQLSFAAVVGILVWSGPLRDLLLRRLGGGPWQRAVAEGCAMSVAATLATAPLMANHFEAVSVAALPANLVVLPAVAPVMWLGMLAAMAGQIPALPVEPINALNSALVGYVAQVASWFASPGWALVDVRLPGVLNVAAAYTGLGAASLWLGGWGRRRRQLALRRGGAPASRRARLRRTAAALAALVLAIALAAAGSAPSKRANGPSLTVRVLDIGQGDAILLQPSDGLPVLVDTGPPDGGVAERLDDAGVGRLAAVALTNADSDHSGGLADALDATRVESILYSDPTRELLDAARAEHARETHAGTGDSFRSGSLRLEVLSPEPRPASPGGDAAVAGEAGRVPSIGQLERSGEDLNPRSLVILARWHRFAMLLTGDAEAEAVHMDPGLIDVLKVAHHGSEDAGLDRLLERTAPRLGVISVGDPNPYGHPTPETLAVLRRRGIPVMRTDRQGTVTIEVGRTDWHVADG